MSTAPTVTTAEIGSPSPDSVPITLDLPKGLVSEAAFKWPADPMARGGMAQIFAGEDRRLGRTVILKAPREGEDLAPGLADMFQRRVTAEARILAKLQHPSIVTIYELGKSTVGWPFCVLERVDGVSLRDKLDDLAEREAHDGKPRTRERLELLANLISIAEALAYAHERRVVHRDCTPNNILLGKRGEATLIDWGIARDLDAPSQSEPSLDDDPSMSGRGVTISAGTPPYLPLEQTQGRAADPSFDVYSFGVTLYEVVAGKPPFEWKLLDSAGERSRQLATFLEWLKQGDPIAPAMPKDPELSGIIARALTHDAAQRFTSDELLRALKQYLTGDLVFSHRYSMTGRLSRWARRNKAVTVGAGALVVFLVGGALVWAQLARQERDRIRLQNDAIAARADAQEKATMAQSAEAEAEQAKKDAEEAQKRGENSEEKRKIAEQKRLAALKAKKDAETAKDAALGTAAQANSRYQEAMKARDAAESQRSVALVERDVARTAQADAERERDAAQKAAQAAERDRETARTAQAAAEKARDDAKSAATAAEQDRDAAREGQTRAEQDRDSAREAATAAERDRDAARAAQRDAERERDELRRKLEEAQRPPPPPPPPNP